MRYLALWCPYVSTKVQPSPTHLPTLKRVALVRAPMRLALVTLVVLSAIAAGCAESPSDPSPNPTSPGTPATTTPASGDHECKAGGANPIWQLETSMGTIRITLFCDKTPITANQIIGLTEAGCYDGTKFHRVIKDFMDQGGDPLSKDDSKAASWGTGGPEDCGFTPDTIVDEFYCKDGTVSTTHPATCASGLGLKHDTPGTLSMANTGRPKTGGSQFFMTAVPTAWLDGKHAVFGHTADQASLDVVLAINKAPTTTGDRPNPPIVLEDASIVWG